MLMGKENRSGIVTLTCIFPVELPGIELGADIRLTCGNIENRYAKRRETTREDLRIRQRC